MSEESGDIDIGGAVEAAANAVFGDGESGDGQGTAVDLGEEDPSPGALEQIGDAIRPVLEYMDDTAEDPPERTGPYPAGGPH
jgi:hypothetical protein